MNSSRFILIALLAVLFSLLSVPPAHAGGSIGWEEVVQQVEKDDPFMAKFIEAQFDVSKVGSGLRIGRHTEVDPDWGPFRLPPFEFLAKPKGAEGEPSLHLTLTPNEDDSWTVAVRKKTVDP